MKICTFDGTYAHFTYTGTDHVTTAFQPGRYIYEDRGRGVTRQLCAYLRPMGNTLSWSTSSDPAIVAKAFARDIGAKLLSADEYEIERVKLEARSAREAAQREAEMAELYDFSVL